MAFTLVSNALTSTPMRLAKLLKKEHFTFGPESLLGGWKSLKDLPKGPAVFSRILAAVVPYSGSISADIKELRPGFAKVVMRDRRRVRNHLKSVHAAALTNLGELATGLAINTAIPKNHRGIVKRLETQFLKKARGVLTAQCEVAEIQPLEENTPFEVVAKLYDSSDVEVARVTATWIIGPEDRKKTKESN